MSPPIDDNIASFFSSLSSNAPEIQRFTLREYRNDWYWPEWARQPGIYFFESRGILQYIGRALRTTLKQRLKDQCGSFGNPKWDVVIKDEATTLWRSPVAASHNPRLWRPTAPARESGTLPRLSPVQHYPLADNMLRFWGFQHAPVR